MKKRRNLLLTIAVFVFLVLAAAVITSLDLTEEKPAYTLFNYRNTGVSLLYDTLKGMGYTVNPEYQKINERSDKHVIRVVIQPDYNYTTENDENAILDYVYLGGRTVYLLNSSFTTVQTLVLVKKATIVYQNGNFFLLSYGLGQIFIGPPTITNGELLDNKNAGYFIADIIKNWQDKAIYFNEAYHGYAAEPNIWSATPVNIKNASYQLLLAAMLIILYFGKRFGAPVPYYEEIEREENEYLTALANVYNKAGNGYIIYESDLERFLEKAARSLDVLAEPGDIKGLAVGLLNAWKERNLPYYDDFLEVLGYKEKDFKTKKTAGRHRLYRARMILDRLEKCL